MSFTDWYEKRSLDEGMARLASREFDARTDVSQETFERDQVNPDLKVDYVVITNASKMLRDLIKAAKTGGTVDPDAYTSFRIDSIDGDVVTMSRNTNQTYSHGQSKTIGIDAIDGFEVTDALQDSGFGRKGTRYFLSAARKGTAPKLRKLMQDWLALSRHSAIGSDKEDHRMAKMASFFGGDQAVKDRINSGANDAKSQMFAGFDVRARRGEDVSAAVADAALDDVSGVSRLQDEKFQRFLSKVAPNAYLQLRLKGQIGQISPDEQKLISGLEQIDKVSQSPVAAQVLTNNPNVDSIASNPNAANYAFVLGLTNAANWIRQNSSGTSSLFNKISNTRQTPVQTQDRVSKPKGLDALLAGESALSESIVWRGRQVERVYGYRD